MTHHAYYLRQEQIHTDEVLQQIFALFDVPSIANPDVHIFSDEVFGVAQARECIVLAQGKPLTCDCRLFIIAPKRITLEAQNALLKILEEPPKHARFVLLAPLHMQLIPTVLSRLQALTLDKNVSAEKKPQADAFDTDAKKFLTGSIGERMHIVERMLAEKNAEHTTRFFASLTRGLRTRLHEKPEKHIAQALKESAELLSYSGDMAASQKQLLEHAALALQRIS